MTFRVVQGAGGAIMFPAALGIVVQTFALCTSGAGPWRCSSASPAASPRSARSWAAI